MTKSNPIEEYLRNWEIKLQPEQFDRLEKFHSELLQKNERFNLISESDINAVWTRHILDALAGLKPLQALLQPNAVIADAGAGAGFPGIPLASTLDSFSFELWDSNIKRHMFLTWAASALKLKNVRAFHKRIGQSGALETGKYDAVIERAMGKLENILPQCLNMLKPGGVFVAWQSSPEKALAIATPEQVIPYRLPDEDKDRFIVVFRKKGENNAHT